MSLSPIQISSECKETSYQGPMSGANEGVLARKNVPDIGLVAKDEVIAINAKPLDKLSFAEWREEWIKKQNEGGKVQLTVKRGESTVTLPTDPKEREVVESTFSKVRSFECENSQGKLYNLTVQRGDENLIFFRENENVWGDIKKQSSGYFKVGIFGGEAKVEAFEQIKKVQVPQIELKPKRKEGALFIAGFHAISPTLVISPSMGVSSGFLAISALGELGFGYDDSNGRLALVADLGVNFFSAIVGGHLVYQKRFGDRWLFGPGVGYGGVISFFGKFLNTIGAGLELSYQSKDRGKEFVAKLFYSHVFLQNGEMPSSFDPAENGHLIILGIGGRISRFLD